MTPSLSKKEAGLVQLFLSKAAALLKLLGVPISIKNFD